MIDHLSYVHAEEKIKPKKTSGMDVIRTHDLCDTGAAL